MYVYIYIYIYIYIYMINRRHTMKLQYTKVYETTAAVIIVVSLNKLHLNGRSGISGISLKYNSIHTVLMD